MLRFTTDDIPAGDRFDHWREVRGKSVFGVTIELEREKRAQFRGQFTAEVYGGAIVSEMEASAYRVSRTKEDVARLSGDNLLISWQVSGGGWMETGRRRDLYRVGAHDLAVGHSDQTYRAMPEGNLDFRYRVIKIPLAGRDFASDRLFDLSPAPIEDRSSVKQPLRALFSAIGARDAFLGDPEDCIDAIGRLALMATGKLRLHDPDNRTALRMALYHMACDILRRDLRRPELSPAHVARELSISPRQLHILFEPSGRSFARTLAGLRLERVRGLLRGRPERNVAEIAFACGFDSLATFYRAFRAAYGMTPLDARAGLHADA
ncbi:AraC family transcriptional regulator [Metarhizobium album]|uniref:AraC family transcriptional regulator n=1 Tax=Metarhizobium album TaxID=2182425 RepID=A0A2U2DMV0_9HYPH|nr:AraC family transcriptional regulator [Rhizobium album]PWE54623.1 AraC family transcriptional regulator [Rhizobium album]